MHRVGVGEQNDLTICLTRAGGACPLFAEPAFGKVRVWNNVQARIASASIARDVSCVVARAVVDHNQLEAGIARRENRSDAAADIAGFVARWNYDADERRINGSRITLFIKRA